MKFLHTGDWHIGRRLHGYTLLEEQEYAFKEMMAIAKEENVDAIVIAGDIYDRSVPAVEAVELFHEMMVTMNLSESLPVLAISGNHDSATRLTIGGPWLAENNFHLHTHLKQAFTPVELGDTQFFLLPYFEPFHGREYFDDQSLRRVNDVMALVVEEMVKQFKPDKNHVLVGHFFAAGSATTDSETTLNVGGLESIALSHLQAFDYVALGHLHTPNALAQEEKIKYSGSLLKYSLSEEKQTKGVRIVELTNHQVTSKFVPVTPLRDVQQITASFYDLTEPSVYQQMNRENYLGVTLTNQEVIPHALTRLREIFPYLIHLDRQTVARETPEEERVVQLDKLSPKDILTNYYTDTTEKELSSQQQTWLEDAIMYAKKEEGK